MNKKKIVEKILRHMARAVLWKHEPIVIGVTGSVGKTTTKDAIAFALEHEYSVRKSIKNYNNEIGVPLTILGATSSPGKSMVRWLVIGCKWLKQMIFSFSYPQVLVLEMAVDHKGDMEYLLSIVQPDISVVTGVSSSHMEFFGSVQAIAKEKMQILKDLSANGFAVLNHDNTHSRTMEKKTKAQVLSYGFEEGSVLRAFNEELIEDDEFVRGMHLKIEYQGKVIPIRLNNIIAHHHIYAILAAFSVASCMQMNLVEIAQNMMSFSLPPSRLQLLPGIRGSWIVDDSYNSSPTSTIAALDTFSTLPAQRKIVVLGDMLELGREEIESHKKLAKPILDQRADMVLLMGTRMKYLKEELEKQDYPKQQIFLFSSPVQVGLKLRTIVRANDYVLIKGSQGARMEKVVEEVLPDRSQARQFLCRQDDRWRQIPYKKV